MADCSRVASTQSAVFGTKTTSAALDKLQHGRLLTRGRDGDIPGIFGLARANGNADRESAASI
jgi:hypothetical protein